MTQWAPKWLQNGWKTTKGKPVTNAADLQELAQEMEGLEVEWVTIFDLLINRSNF